MGHFEGLFRGGCLFGPLIVLSLEWRERERETERKRMKKERESEKLRTKVWAIIFLNHPGQNENPQTIHERAE
jgi:hypothetical protein